MIVPDSCNTHTKVHSNLYRREGVYNSADLYMGLWCIVLFETGWKERIQHMIVAKDRIFVITLKQKRKPIRMPNYTCKSLSWGKRKTSERESNVTEKP